MGKRVYEVAKELGVKPAEVLERLKEAGIIVKDHLAPLTKDQEAKAKELLSQPKKGDVEVKKIAEGRVVRRRKAQPQAPQEEVAPAKAAEEIKIAPKAEKVEKAEAIEEAKHRIDVKPEVEAPIEEPVSPPMPAGVLEKEVVPSPQEPQKTELAPQLQVEETRKGESEPPIVGAEVVAKEAQAVAPEVEEKVPEKPSKKQKELEVIQEVPEKKGKPKRFVYDRRRDVISLRQLIISPDEEPEPAVARHAFKRHKAQKGAKKAAPPPPPPPPKEQKRVIRVEGEAIQVQELARHMGIKASELVAKLMGLGVLVSITQMIDLDTAAIVASDWGFTVEKVGFDASSLLQESKDPEDALKPRPPVVTVMGHVDHGKTTLLDRIRQTRVAESEAGGITQHIGAYKVHLDRGDIVFLDTPGHEAFTQMRARGAKVTDIVVLVVAADDGVKAQTLEAIAHARDAQAPIIVAINKIDKPEANVDRVKKELAEQGLIPEEWGGQTIFCEISAKMNIGIDNLLEMILLQAEMMDLKANPNKPARGVVLEAKLDRQLGPLATVLVQAGTLRVGDLIIAGLAHGKVRKMMDERGVDLSEAIPVTPVQVVGFNLVPNAGDAFVVLPDERKVKEVIEWQMTQIKKARAAKGAVRVSLEDFYKMVQQGKTKELKVIVRADVQGSLQAIIDALSKLQHPEITLKIIHSAVGNITESDVNLAIASNSVIIGFNVATDPNAQTLADHEKVQIRRYNVIYDLLEDVKKAMEGLLEPKMVLKPIGKGMVLKVFNISKVGRVAGVAVTQGKVTRSSTVKVVRGKDTIFEGKISSLKHLKDDVREVKQGMECGLMIQDFDAFEEGDELHFFEIEEVRSGLSVSA
jgi:translation initiation factor IF-2